MLDFNFYSIRIRNLFVVVAVSLNTFVFCNTNQSNASIKTVDVSRTKIWGPGLEPDKIVLPVRYFYIQPIDGHGNSFNASLPVKFAVEIHGESIQGKCRSRIEQLDRRDGTYIVRYKIAHKCKNFEIHVQYKGYHVAHSPYRITGTIYSDKCRCPEEIDRWLENNKCRMQYDQIDDDLKPFKAINFTAIRPKILEKFDVPGSISLCNYAIKDNRIYRKCHGQYTGFKMFADAILEALVKRVKLPDTEFLVNLGDWPLVKKGGVARTHGPYPIFSWCGSDDTFDITLPTYDLTESTLEAMNRVTLDMLSVQNAHLAWNEKTPIAFWRGRDSSRERLALIDIARENVDLFNVSLTNFFFFRDKESKYGPKTPHTSFFEFFDYKYQLNLDGTVAAYRFPYLLAGNSVVFKQESPFYEHFYKQLRPMQHYIPIKRDLSDLVEKLKWAIKNDDAAQKISKKAQEFANQNLMPDHVLCYHVQLLKEWSRKLVDKVHLQADMEQLVELNVDESCNCEQTKVFSARDEL